MSDGSIDPVTAPISIVGNVYTLEDNINDPIVVEKSNIVLDGVGYKLTGSGETFGVSLGYVDEVTIKNLVIQGFYHGILIKGGGGHFIKANYVANNDLGICLNFTDLNYITHNVVAENGFGFYFDVSALNTIGLNKLIMKS